MTGAIRRDHSDGRTLCRWRRHRLPALPRVHGRPDAEYDIAGACGMAPFDSRYLRILYLNVTKGRYSSAQAEQWLFASVEWGDW